jgi:amino acid transporter
VDTHQPGGKPPEPGAAPRAGSEPAAPTGSTTGASIIPPLGQSHNNKIVVATTVALSFISFWRAAAIVLSDLASSSYYAGGIAEQAIGKSAPWMVLGVMLFSFAVRSVYMESCSMFVRGGVYVVVRDSIGPGMAKLSVSALVVDYVLTGPISSVSAGQYLGRLLNEIFELTHQSVRLDPNTFAMFFGLVVTAYFWRSNIRGIHESSGKALRIMQIMTVMVVIMIFWSLLTIAVKGTWELPPLPALDTLHFSEDALGWFKDTVWPGIAAAAFLIAFGHSLLAMSGFETLAQVYREVAYPKLKNLKITANIVCCYAVISTGVITMLAAMVIPDDKRAVYFENLIGGMTEFLIGPRLLTLAFHIFVVIVGVLILSGAVNTSIIGANGVLNRVAEDRVLLDWFRRPHSRFGTTYRVINLVAILQAGTIVASGGSTYLLGEAYAFGVVWSFFLKALGVMALRFQRSDQDYKFPFNFRVGKLEIPLGLGLVTLVLFLVAITNLFSKKVATIYGVGFTLVLYLLFRVSEAINKRKEADKALEQFNLEHSPQVDTESLSARPGAVLVAVRGYRQMDHLKATLQKTNLRRHDIVVMTVRPISSGAGEYQLSDDQLFTDYEQELFSHVVEMAEKEGKPVELLVVPALDPFDAMVQTAQALKASRLVTGVSAKMTSDELARQIGLAWERLPEPRHPLSLEVIRPDRPSKYVNLGPHPPRLWPQDIDRLHDIWLDLTGKAGLGSALHHRDVVGVALQRMERELSGETRQAVIDEVSKEMGKG